MTIIRIGIDLAKNTFAVCGFNEHNQIALEKNIQRRALLKFFATIPPCQVAMEAGSGAHHWARELNKLGHQACYGSSFCRALPYALSVKL